ncbi:hypothetical protein Fcan01_11659 [Folsomia candida]|uniref:Uncharacterized protein n=1 Tax=Folsomia candida TaxID=158441 RepID=A0A226EBS8_FOLCA|nr:hypothetical protein Fcan01_11659 [Folsomia candida]
MLALFILVLSLSPQTTVASFWTIPDYFSSKNLFFVQLWRRNGATSLPYFYQTISNNPNSPIILNEIFVNKTLMGLLGWWDDDAPMQVKSVSVSVAFIETIFDLGAFALPIHYWIQDVMMRNINPTYIFQHAPDPWNSGNFKNYEWHLGTSKIILFTLYIPGVLFIPCVTCPDIPPSQVWTIPFHNLDEIWRAENTNLAQRHVQIGSHMNLEKLNCGVTLAWLESYILLNDCIIVHLSQFLNFSFIYFTRAKNAVTNLMVPKLLNADTLPTVAQAPFRFAPYSMRTESTKFIIVTQLPSSLEGMNAFLLPFTATVWLVLFATGVAICGLAGVVKTQKNPLDIGIDFIHLIAMLLKQVCNESSYIFGGNHIGQGVIWLWLFFGSNIIMDNLYTGEIFSYLSAIKIRQMPETLMELVDSNIPILTLHDYTVTGIETRVSGLIGDRIPGYIRFLNGRNDKSAQLVRQLAEKVVFFDAFASTNYVSFITTILTMGNLTVLNGSVDTGLTYAVIDIEGVVGILAALLKSNGSRLVLNAREDFPLITMYFGQTSRNWVYPIITRRLGNLKASGIEGVWAKLEIVWQLADSQRIAGYPSHEIRFFATHKFAMRQSVVQSEEGATKVEAV